MLYVIFYYFTFNLCVTYHDGLDHLGEVLIVIFLFCKVTLTLSPFPTVLANDFLNYAHLLL